MASVNKVILIGNLTRDPELRYTPKGTAVCELGLAVNRKYKLDTGETREEVTFLDVSFWSKGGETIAKYLKKGNPLYVEGRLQMDTWDDKTSGQKRSKIKIIGEEFQFLGGGERQSRGPEGGDDDHRSAAPTQRTQSSASSQSATDTNVSGGLDDDDIPF